MPRSHRSPPRPPAWPIADYAPPSPRRGHSWRESRETCYPRSWSSLQSMVLEKHEERRARVQIMLDAVVTLGGDRIGAPAFDLIEFVKLGGSERLGRRDVSLGHRERDH